jgi:hypothetical protein
MYPLYHWVDTSTNGLFVPYGIILPNGQCFGTDTVAFIYVLFDILLKGEKHLHQFTRIRGLG